MDTLERDRSETTVTVEVDADLLDWAHELGLPVSSIMRRAVEEAVDNLRSPQERADRSRAWQADNAAALEERRRLNAETPLPLERWQNLRVPGIAPAAFDE